MCTRVRVHTPRSLDFYSSCSKESNVDSCRLLVPWTAILLYLWVCGYEESNPRTFIQNIYELCLIAKCRSFSSQFKLVCIFKLNTIARLNKSLVKISINKLKWNRTCRLGIRVTPTESFCWLLGSKYNEDKEWPNFNASDLRITSPAKYHFSTSRISLGNSNKNWFLPSSERTSGEFING